MAQSKLRLDHFILEKNPTLTRNYIQSLIIQGKVTVDGKIQTKSGTMIKPDAVVIIDQEEQKYVSRAGFKLEKALDYFGIDVSNLIALDAGISTGGFTDCLLQRGVQKVYGVDVGYGDVHEKVRNNEKLVLLERTNLRYVENLPQLVDIITLDLSFISVTKVIDAVTKLLKVGGKLVILIKPQFEVQKHMVGAKGIIKDPAVHEFAIQSVEESVKDSGYSLVGVIDSPITGTTGNKEFLAYFIKQ